MAKLTKVITINTPVDKVFGFMNYPGNLPEIWPSMVEVKDIKPAPVGSYNFGWVYKMAGIKIDGASEVTEFIDNQRIVTKSTKGISSTFVWNYEAKEGGTKLTVDVEYVVPVPVLGKLAESFIIKQNEHEADAMLANLKARMEA